MKKAFIFLLMMVFVISLAHAENAENQDNEIITATPSNTTSVLGSAMMDTGIVVCAKMKSIAAGKKTKYNTATDDIKAIRMADTLPEGFKATDKNTVSSKDSEFPVYIFFDNTDDAGILYVYSGGHRVLMNPDSSFAFCSHSSLADISGLADWNTGSVTEMYALFAGDSLLSDASALAAWDTSSVVDMSYMFAENISLSFIDVANWDTSHVVNMNSMFQVGYSGAGNGALIEIRGLDKWDVSNVTDMTCMFYGAGQMTHYDISGWNVSNVQSFNHMFCDNFMLQSLDLSGWNVQSVQTMYDMFDDCRKLTTIGNVSHWNTANLIDIGGWLNAAYSFVGDNGVLDLSGWDTNNLKVTGEAFRANGLEVIDLSGWTFDSVINGRWHGAGRGIFYEYGNQYDIYMGMHSMFKDSKNLKTVYLSQSGLDSFNVAVINGVNIDDMWEGTKTSAFSEKTN